MIIFLILLFFCNIESINQYVEILKDEKSKILLNTSLGYFASLGLSLLLKKNSTIDKKNMIYGFLGSVISGGCTVGLYKYNDNKFKKIIEDQNFNSNIIIDNIDSLYKKIKRYIYINKENLIENQLNNHLLLSNLYIAVNNISDNTKKAELSNKIAEISEKNAICNINQAKETIADLIFLHEYTNNPPQIEISYQKELDIKLDQYQKAIHYYQQAINATKNFNKKKKLYIEIKNLYIKIIVLYTDVASAACLKKAQGKRKQVIKTIHEDEKKECYLKIKEIYKNILQLYTLDLNLMRDDEVAEFYSMTAELTTESNDKLELYQKAQEYYMRAIKKTLDLNEKIWLFYEAAMCCKIRADLIEKTNHSEKIKLYKEAIDLHLQRIQCCKESTETIYTISCAVESYKQIEELEKTSQKKYNEEIVKCYKKAIKLATSIDEKIKYLDTLLDEYKKNENIIESETELTELIKYVANENEKEGDKCFLACNDLKEESFEAFGAIEERIFKADFFYDCAIYYYEKINLHNLKNIYEKKIKILKEILNMNFAEKEKMSKMSTEEQKKILKINSSFSLETNINWYNERMIELIKKIIFNYEAIQDINKNNNKENEIEEFNQTINNYRKLIGQLEEKNTKK